MKKQSCLVILFVIGLVLLTSCNSDSNKSEASPNNNQIIARNTDASNTGASNTDVSNTEPEDGPSESMFRIEMQVPEEIKAGQSFEVKGFLINTSNHDWDIFHGAGMFTYAIYDDQGELVPRNEKMIAVNDIGIGTTLKPNSKYNYDGQGHVSTKLYELKVNKRGQYEIICQAEFSINYNDKVYEFQIQSDPQAIKVQ